MSDKEETELTESNAGMPPAQEWNLLTLDGHYPLDWRTTDVKLGKGRFVHTLRHPSADEQRQYDAELQIEIPIGRDGAYQMPDPTANEIPAAKFYDTIAESATGYPHAVPTRHKAKVVNDLYTREWDIDSSSSIFDDHVMITEEVGRGEVFDFRIIHKFRQPDEDELRAYRRRTMAGEMRPGKRGRQIFATKSDLRTACEFYDKWIVSIAGATVGGATWDPDRRAEFLAAVDPLIKRAAVQTLVGKLDEALSD